MRIKVDATTCIAAGANLVVGNGRLPGNIT